MKSKIQVFKTVLKNPVILFIINKYGMHFIQFINYLFIPAYLGPYYLGIWGFINLVIGYIVQFNFGITNSVTVMVSVEKENEEQIKKYLGNALTMFLLLSTIIVVFLSLVALNLLPVGLKYNFSHYILPVIIISVLNYINVLFTSILRVFGKITIVAICQSLYPVIVLFLIPFFRGEQLLWALLWTNSLSLIISFLLMILKTPLRFKPYFEFEIIKKIQIKGWFLFVYNSSFYFIILTTNSFISSNYGVKEYGYYTFSYSLANIILLLLGSLSYLISPKLLNRFSSKTNEQISNILEEVRRSYISLAHLMVHLIIMLIPLFLYFFKGYSKSYNVFILTVLTVVLHTNSFGHQEVFMAKGKEKLIARIGLGALLLNIVFAAVLIFILRVPFNQVILATSITYSVYVFVLGLYTRKILDLKSNFLETFKDVYPWRLMLPFILSLLFAILELNEISFIVPFGFFVILNLNDLFKIKDLLVNVVKNPNIINI